MPARVCRGQAKRQRHSIFEPYRCQQVLVIVVVLLLKTCSCMAQLPRTIQCVRYIYSHSGCNAAGAACNLAARRRPFTMVFDPAKSSDPASSLATQTFSGQTLFANGSLRSLITTSKIYLQTRLQVDTRHFTCDLSHKGQHGQRSAGAAEDVQPWADEVWPGGWA